MITARPPRFSSFAACAAVCLMAWAPSSSHAAAATETEADAAEVKKPTVAILYFDYGGQDEQMGYLRKGLTQMLISDLTHVDTIDLIERTRLQEILEELELQRSTKIDPDSAVEVGKLLGARYMVLGGYFDLMGTLRVDARVVDVETGRIVRSMGANGKQDDFLAIEQRIAEQLEELFTSSALEGIRPRPKADDAPDGPKVEPPPRRPRPRPKTLRTTTAVRYARALDAMDQGDKRGAQEQLEAVVKEQPDFTLAAADLESLLQ